MNTRFIRRLATIVGSAVVVAGLALLILQLTSGGGSSDRNTAAAAPSSAQSVESNFGVLRRSPTATDAVPDRWRNQLAAGQAPGGGPIDVSSARRVALGPNQTFWVTEQGGSVCLLAASADAAGFGCHTNDEVLAGDAIGVSSGVGFGLQPNQVEVSGLLPDGASGAQLVLRDGSSQPVTLQNNVYSVVASGAPDRITWTDAGGGSHSVAVPDSN